MKAAANTISKSQFKTRALEYFRRVEKTQTFHYHRPRQAVLKIVPFSDDPQEVLEKLRDSVVKCDTPTQPVGERDWEGFVNRTRYRLEDHAPMVALYFMYDNFGRVHQTLRVTPAMEAGICKPRMERRGNRRTLGRAVRNNAKRPNPLDDVPRSGDTALANECRSVEPSGIPARPDAGHVFVVRLCRVDSQIKPTHLLI
jgi:hypothetical protein